MALVLESFWFGVGGVGGSIGVDVDAVVGC